MVAALHAGAVQAGLRTNTSPTSIHHSTTPRTLPGTHRNLPNALSYPRRLQFRRINLRKRAIAANFASRSDFNDTAQRLADAVRKRAKEAANFAKSAVNEKDLKKRVRRAMDGANEWMVETAFEARQTASRFNRRYRVSEKVDEALEFAKDRARRIDGEFNVSQRARTLSVDFRRNWPRYKKELDTFFNTPLGKGVSFLFFLWLVTSGWLFRIIILGTWVLPFAAPLLIGAVAKRTMIEGVCPACKRKFVGNRNQIIQCMNCRATVWQPRDDFSKGSSDPEIIDIDIEEK